MQTRWGTWLTAIEYYTQSQYYDQNKTTIFELENEAAAIAISKELFEDDSLRNDLVYIKSN